MTTYYVSTTGSNGNSGTSTGAAWKTIQYAVENVSAGDTIYVMAGTYAEHVDINAGNAAEGESGSEITLASYTPASPAIITQSYDAYGAKTTTQRLRIVNRSHWVVDGIKFDNYETGGVYCYAGTQNVVGIVIQNCTFDRQADKTGTWSHVISMGGIEPYAISYCSILDNSIGNVKTGPSGYSYNECVTIYRSAHNILVKGNTVQKASYLTFDIISKSDQYGRGLCHHIIIDGNTVHAAESDAYGNNNGFKIDGGDYIVVQNNKGFNVDFCASGSEPWGNSYKLTEADPYQYHLWRNNVWDTRNFPTAGNFGAFLGSDRFTARGTGSYGWLRNLYFVHNFLAGARSEYSCILICVAWNVRIKNNVVWHNGGGSGMLTRYYSGWVDWARDFRTTGWEFAANLWYTTGLPKWEMPSGATYYSGTTGAALTAWRANVEPTAEWGLPVFGDDYILTSGSPGYGDGASLTTAVGSGSSSTTLYVRDAGYFCDGFGLIAGDTIYIGGVSAQVAAVDYANNKITLAAAKSWSNGAAVGYAASPSIGVLSAAGSDGTVDPVTAAAGPDQTVLDMDGDGYATVTLNGAGSRATGTISTYVWTPAAWGIAATAAPTVSLPLGTHVLTLTVTDTDGNSDTDTVTITVREPGDNPQGALVRNPCLQGTDGWLLHTSGVTTWTEVTGGGLEVEVTAAGGNTQLSQPGIAVGLGEQITLRLVATADTTPQALAVSLFKDTSPFTNYGLAYSAAIGTTETVVEYTFFATAQAQDARLMIFFDTGAHVTIKEFNLLRAGESGCYDEDYTPVTGSGSVTVTSSDDYFCDEGGQFSADASPTFAGDWRTTFNNFDYFTGWIFALGGTAIPDGAVITDATLAIASAGYQGALPKLRVDVENAANPIEPTTNANARGRTWITGSAWQAVAWATSVEYTIDIDTDAIQALIDTQGGIAGAANVHVRLIDADGGFQVDRLAYIGTAAAELYIAWDAPAAAELYVEESTTLRTGMNFGYKIGL